MGLVLNDDAREKKLQNELDELMAQRRQGFKMHRCKPLPTAYTFSSHFQFFNFQFSIFSFFSFITSFH